MKLRSGVCTHTVPSPVPVPTWPSAETVEKMSITTNVPSEFEAYCRKLLRIAVTVQSSREVAMYISQSLINISKIPHMRQRYSLHTTMLQKFYEYEGPEYPFEFVMKLKRAFTTPDKHASKIQRAFRKSRGYAEWAWHPDRLKAQGFFDDEVA